jgi:hypothetical protein
VTALSNSFQTAPWCSFEAPGVGGVVSSGVEIGFRNYTGVYPRVPERRGGCSWCSFSRKISQVVRRPVFLKRSFGNWLHRLHRLHRLTFSVALRWLRRATRYLSIPQFFACDGRPSVGSEMCSLILGRSEILSWVRPVPDRHSSLGLAQLFGDLLPPHRGRTGLAQVWSEGPTFLGVHANSRPVSLGAGLKGLPHFFNIEARSFHG